MTHLYRYLKEWSKHPQWTFSCCLALVLPLLDLSGEINGVAATNIINDQLQSGDIEMPTVVAAVQDSGAVDLTLGKDEPREPDVTRNTTVVQEDDCEDRNLSITKSQGTQTELSMNFSVVDDVIINF